MATYTTAKEKWELAHPSKSFPAFRWSLEHPGPNNADLTDYFTDIDDLRIFIETSNPEKLYETSFRTI